METVNVQCGHCGKLMAVSTAHLGARVSCPHCQGVVEAPPKPQPIATEPPEIKVPSADTVESIFAAPENEATEDIFALEKRPIIEMPTAAEGSVTQEALPEPTAAPSLQVPEPFAPSDNFRKPAADGETIAWGASDKAPADQAVEEIGPRRYVAKRSLVGPILLMFLIPYALFTTGFIAWLLYSRSKAPDPFEYLKDPAPAKDGPEKKASRERIKYDAQLPATLRTPLGKRLRVGDVEVTPFKVVRSNGDLALHLKLRNLAADVSFNPLPDAFADVRTFRPNKPYTFLDGGGPDYYVLGGSIAYQRGRKDLFQDGRLAPGEEMTATLTTDVSEREQLTRVLRARESLLWRVQLRRGLVNVGGTFLSATAVIGVEFPRSAIEGPLLALLPQRFFPKITR